MDYKCFSDKQRLPPSPRISKTFLCNQSTLIIFFSQAAINKGALHNGNAPKFTPWIEDSKGFHDN